MQAEHDNSTEPKSNWWGPFYFNLNDARVFLPKRWGWGWTLNFASRWTYAILFAPAVLAAGVVAATRLLGH